mmetsp:Transcript_1223/g.3016  ORF Transcript_1223/g.3016 Transcript_1223/m.3016 type:complete len:89 (-) Transcript_1223:18-284(-)
MQLSTKSEVVVCGTARGQGPPCHSAGLCLRSVCWVLQVLRAFFGAFRPTVHILMHEIDLVFLLHEFSTEGSPSSHALSCAALRSKWQR